MPSTVLDLRIDLDLIVRRLQRLPTQAEAREILRRVGWLYDEATERGSVGDTEPAIQAIRRYIGPHDILQARDYDDRLWFIRLDDRGDLGCYVFAPELEDAIEWAEEYAEAQGWEVNPDDVAFMQAHRWDDSILSGEVREPLVRIAALLLTIDR